jgi:hypothetical protein
VVFEPYGAAAAPYPVEPQPAGSEYMRWVQSALNTCLAWGCRCMGPQIRPPAAPFAAFSSVKGFPPMALSAPIRNVR